MNRCYRTRGWMMATTLLAILVLGLPGAVAQDQNDATTQSADTGRQTILVGELVDLKKYMTGDTSTDKKSDKDPIDKLEDRLENDKNDDTPRRPGAGLDDDDDGRPGIGNRGDDATKDPSKHANKDWKSSDRVYALKTARGLVILSIEQQPGVLATPRTDQDKPGQDKQPGRDRPNLRDNQPKPNNPTDSPNDQDNPRNRIDDQSHADQNPASCLNKQVRVDGKLYEKEGLRFMVVKSMKKTAGADIVPPVRRGADR